MIVLRGIDFGCVFAAAGTLNFFGEGWPWHRIVHLLPGFDFSSATLITKTTPLEPRQGNMPLDGNFQPREFFPDCIKVKFFEGVVLNAVGLSGPGARVLLEHNRWQRIKKPFFISFMAVGKTKKDRMEEVGRFVHLLQEELGFFYSKIGLEINISCPNTEHDSTELTQEAIEYLQIASTLNIPLVIKLNVLVSDEAVKRIVNSGLCDAIDISNTIPWGQLPERINWKDLFDSEKSPLMRFGGGGLSGKPLLLIVAERIKAFRKVGITLPIIGGGGILSKNGVDVLKEVGADAVSIGSVSILRPWRVKGIIDYANKIFRGGM